MLACRRLEFCAQDVFLQRTPISFDVSVKLLQDNIQQYLRFF